MNFFGVTVDWFFVLKEGIGVLGILAAICAFQCKRHYPLMAFRTANELLFAVQYVLLGAYTGAAMNLLGCVRNMTFAHMVQKGKNTLVMRYVFSAVILLMIAFTWEGPRSLLSGIAKTVSTFAYGSSRTSLVRILTLGTSTAWLIYNAAIGSYAGVVCEVLTLASIITGIIRLDIRKKEKPDENPDA